MQNWQRIQLSKDGKKIFAVAIDGSDFAAVADTNASTVFVGNWTNTGEERGVLP